MDEIWIWEGAWLFQSYNFSMLVNIWNFFHKEPIYCSHWKWVLKALGDALQKRNFYWCVNDWWWSFLKVDFEVWRRRAHESFVYLRKNVCKKHRKSRHRTWKTSVASVTVILPVGVLVFQGYLTAYFQVQVERDKHDVSTQYPNSIWHIVDPQ